MWHPPKTSFFEYRTKLLFEITLLSILVKYGIYLGMTLSCSIILDEIHASFCRFGPLTVDWPHKAESKSYFPPKGNLLVLSLWHLLERVFISYFSGLYMTCNFLMIFPVRGVTSSASEHSFSPYIYVLRTLRVDWYAAKINL